MTGVDFTILLAVSARYLFVRWLEHARGPF
jgi:hypothetical protein